MRQPLVLAVVPTLHEAMTVDAPFGGHVALENGEAVLLSIPTVDDERLLGADSQLALLREYPFLKRSKSNFK